MIYLRSAFLKDFKTLHYSDEFISINTIHSDISSRSGIPIDSFILFYNGKRSYLSQKIPQDATIDVCFPLLGGKGGFGSMLRAIGAQIEKTTNREACRDLSGRRLRDINEEQRLKRWLSKKAEREAEQLERRKRRLERLKESPKHEFHDPDYNRERSELPERIDDALSQGLKKASQLGKKSNKAESNTEPSAKKKRKWLDAEISSDNDDNSSQSSDGNSQFSQASSSESIDSDASKFATSDTASTSSSNQMKTFQDIQVESQADNQREEPDSSKESQQLELLRTSAEIEPQQKLPQSKELISKPESKELISKQESKELISKPEDHKVEKEISHSIDNAKPLVLSQTKGIKDNCILDLLKFESPNELESLGLDKLKTVLTNMGLKCGGTLIERVDRLWAVRGLDPQNYPTALRAKKKKS